VPLAQGAALVRAVVVDGEDLIAPADDPDLSATHFPQRHGTVHEVVENPNFDRVHAATPSSCLMFIKLRSW
jgi:hypothetical protein